MKEKKINRIEYVDIFKAIGIILMIVGHIWIGSSFDHFIHAFHMPMFFWISGFLFKYDNSAVITTKEFIIKKVKSLLVPYFAFGIIHYVIYLLIGGKDISPFINLFNINTSVLPIAGALWFLTALFFTDIIYFIVVRYVKKTIIRSIIILFVTLFGCFYKKLFSFTLPLAIGPAMVGIGLFYFGVLMRKYNDILFSKVVFNMSLWKVLISFFILIKLIFYNGYINMRMELYSNVFLFFVISIFSVILCMFFSNVLYKYCGKNIIGKWLISIGRNSIVYVCLNQLFLLVINNIFNYISFFNMFNSTLKFIITFILVFGLLWVSSFIFNKTKLKVLLGKF